MRISDIHMTDAVQFLFLSGILVFSDHTVYIIIHRTAGHNSCLAAAVHGKLIQIVGLLRFRHIDAVCNLLIQKFSGLFIYPVVICIHICWKLRLRPVNI